MHELVGLLVMLGGAGIILTVAGAIAIWHADEGRRIRRGLKIILKADLHGYLVARGRGRGLGFNFTSNRVGVAWDQGAWGLVYRLDELIGAEVIADGVVVGRAYRGETRRALDSLGGAEHRVALRLVFDDLTKPEFVLDLWLPVDETRRGALTASEALEECNRWLARIEALFRRPMAPRPAPQVAAPSAPPLAPVVSALPEARRLPELTTEEAEDDETPF
jgi:hypothetical protein